MDVAYPVEAVPGDEYEAQATYYRKAVVTWGVDGGHSWLRRFKDFAGDYTDRD